MKDTVKKIQIEISGDIELEAYTEIMKDLYILKYAYTELNIDAINIYEDGTTLKNTIPTIE